MEKGRANFGDGGEVKEGGGYQVGGAWRGGAESRVEKRSATLCQGLGGAGDGASFGL